MFLQELSKKKGFFKIRTSLMQKIAKFQEGFSKIVSTKMNKMANFNISKEVYGHKFCFKTRAKMPS